MQYRQNTDAAGVFECYWYEKNLQGDVVAVYNSQGTKLVSYRYTAYGDVYTTYYNGGSSTGAAKNPFKYRGYYYDSDLQLDYLRSRYYDPRTCRFISPDDVSYLGASGDLRSYNLYAYCSNDPVNYVDPSGHSVTVIVGMIVAGALIGAAFAGLIEAAKQIEKSGEITSVGTVANKAIVGGALGFSSAVGVAFLGPVLAGSAAASAGGALAAFISSVGLSIAAGAGGYVAQERIDGNNDPLDTNNVLGHAAVVGAQGISNFLVGGMVGSIGTPGSKGVFGSKEFISKFLLTQEFALPFKIATDKLRHGLWG